MSRKLMMLGCLVGAFSSFAPPLHAANCDAIKDLKLPDTTITLAERIGPGALDVPEMGEPLRHLPVFCRVTGVLRPTADSEIHFEVWMPESGWNQRFLGVGNGGFGGSIGYGNLAGNLGRGFATAGSDAGHSGTRGKDASWALGHPEKIKDYDWRAVHLTTERAKDIVKAYYGRPVQKAYFEACSDGGREALMEAERFPGDYDGILAGSPAIGYTRMLSAQVPLAQQMLGKPGAYISAEKLPAIQRSALAACDGLDGVKDGIIGNPAQCHFDPQVLLCKGKDSPDCLTQPQVNSLKAYYAGGKDSQGRSIFPGLVMGDEAHGWADQISGHGPGTGTVFEYAQSYFRNMVMGDPKFDILTANVDESVRKATEKTSADMDAMNLDLSRFNARGGKLIIYHGWDDPALSPWNTVAYYKRVQQAMGERKTESFLRLYMVPGMEHCGKGPGADSFGQANGRLSPTGYGLFDALRDWVEQGTAPGNMTAAKYATGPDKPRVLMTRPLCAYPTVAKYQGGDMNDAANFVCTKE